MEILSNCLISKKYSMTQNALESLQRARGLKLFLHMFTSMCLSMDFLHCLQLFLLGICNLFAVDLSS